MKYSPIYPNEESLSTGLKRARNKRKQRISLYPGDVMIRELYLRTVLEEIARLEDMAYAYQNMRKQEQI